MYMFLNTGYNYLNVDLGNLSNWNTINVTNMENMFWYAGMYSNSFNIGDISEWNTGNVTNMTGMFGHTAINAIYNLDLSSWDVSKVTNYENFNSEVESKVTPPNFGA